MKIIYSRKVKLLRFVKVSYIMGHPVLYIRCTLNISETVRPAKNVEYVEKFKRRSTSKYFKKDVPEVTKLTNFGQPSSYFYHRKVN